MEYEPKTYFTENEEPSVKGFIIINAKNDQYHIAEKWNREEGEARWMQYWIQEGQLLSRVKDKAVTPKAKVSDEQFKQVCGLVGLYSDEEQAEILA